MADHMNEPSSRPARIIPREQLLGTWGLLSARQQEIAQHVANGKTEDWIAEQLGIAVETLRHHIREITNRIPTFVEGVPEVRITRLYNAAVGQASTEDRKLDYDEGGE